MLSDIINLLFTNIHLHFFLFLFYLLVGWESIYLVCFILAIIYSANAVSFVISTPDFAYKIPPPPPPKQLKREQKQTKTAFFSNIVVELFTTDIIC